MNKRLDKIKRILINDCGLREQTAYELMLKHDELIDKKLSNNESEESIATLLEDAWIEERTDSWLDLDMEVEDRDDTE